LCSNGRVSNPLGDELGTRFCGIGAQVIMPCWDVKYYKRPFWSMYNSVWMLPLSINFVTKPCCFSDICFRNRFVYKSWLEVIIFCFIGKGKVNRNLWALTQSLLLENKRWFLTKVFGEFQGINFDQGLVCYTFLPFSTQIMYFFPRVSTVLVHSW